MFTFRKMNLKMQKQVLYGFSRMVKMRIINDTGKGSRRNNLLLSFCQKKGNRMNYRDQRNYENLTKEYTGRWRV